MVLESKHTTVAYRCPYCGAGVMSAVNMFNISADMVKLKCTCGKSELKAVFTKSGEVRLEVPCIICPNSHNFTVSKKIFFGKELFVLPCPYSDVNICIIGEGNQVKAELARTELELLDMLEENGIDDFRSLHGDEETLADPEILQIITFVIKDLDAEGKIFCKCPPRVRDGNGECDPETSHYDVEVTNDGIRVTCTECGCTRLIPTDSMLGAHAFLNCDALYLTDDENEQ